MYDIIIKGVFFTEEDAKIIKGGQSKLTLSIVEYQDECKLFGKKIGGAKSLI